LFDTNITVEVIWQLLLVGLDLTHIFVMLYIDFNIWTILEEARLALSLPVSSFDNLNHMAFLLTKSNAFLKSINAQYSVFFSWLITLFIMFCNLNKNVSNIHLHLLGLVYHTRTHASIITIIETYIYKNYICVNCRFVSW